MSDKKRTNVTNSIRFYQVKQIDFVCKNILQLLVLKIKTL